MKGKAIAALVAITAVIAVAMFAGCVDEEAPEYILISQKDLVLTRFISTVYGTTEADSGYSFVVLDFAIENHGYESFEVNPFAYHIIVDNVKYDYDSSTYSIIDGLRSVELLDGGTTRGKIVFMIPETEHVECSGDFDTGYYNIKFEKDTGDTRG